jgi:hypothetical protein
MPKLTELEEAMTKKFGIKNKKNQWMNVKIMYEDDQNILDELVDT